MKNVEKRLKKTAAFFLVGLIILIFVLIYFAVTTVTCSGNMQEIAAACADITSTTVIVTFGSVISFIICIVFLLGVKEGQYHWNLIFLVLYYITLIMREICDSVLVCYTAIPCGLCQYFIGGVSLIPLFIFVSLWFYSGWRKRAAFITSVVLGIVLFIEYYLGIKMHIYRSGLFFGWMEVTVLILFLFWIYKEYKQTTAVLNKEIVIWLVPELLISSFVIILFEGSDSNGMQFYWSSLIEGIRNGNPQGTIDFITETVALVVTFSVIQGIYMQSVNIRKTISFYEMRSQMVLEREQNNRRTMEQLREFKHEVRHHIVTLHGLIENSEYDRALTYIEKMDSGLKNLTPLQYSKNLLVDTIVNVYAEKMKEKKISFNYDLTLPEKIEIDDMDLSMLLTNLLENAVEACEKSNCSDKVFISLFMTVENQIVYIIIHNYSGGCSSFDSSGNIRTSKQDQTSHGLGMKVIKKIVYKYNGEMQITTENHEFNFSAFLNQK